MMYGDDQARARVSGRDFDANPYSADEQRAADALLRQIPDTGTGDDPLGFLVASWEQIVAERKAGADALAEGWHAGDRLCRGAGSFGDALFALKGGSRVARAGWNGKAMWLALSGPLKGRTIPAEQFWSSNNREYAEMHGGSATVLPCITMKTATGEILMGWLASQSDMLSSDWCVVGGDHGA